MTGSIFKPLALTLTRALVLSLALAALNCSVATAEQKSQVGSEPHVPQGYSPSKPAPGLTIAPSGTATPANTRNDQSNGK